MFKAAKAGDIDAVKRHLRAHINVNAQDEVAFKVYLVMFK